MAKKKARNFSARTLARQITADLFVNGYGDKARRLALIDDGARDLGGWCESAMADRIEMHLRRANQGDQE